MKKLLFLLLFIAVVFQAKSQKNLIYDFAKGDFDKPIEPVQIGQFVKIQIKNINTFRYKVEIEGASINYVTPVPSELQTLFRLPDQSKVVSKTNEAVQNLAQPVEAMKLLKQDAIAEGNALVTKKDSVTKQKEQDLVDAMKKLVAACEQYLEVAKAIANIKYTRVELINLSKQKWENYAQMQEKLPPALAEATMRHNYDIFVSYYAKTYVLYDKAKEAATALEGPNSDKVKAILKAETEVSDGNQAIYEDDFLKIIEDVLVLQEALNNANYFTVFSPPIQVDADYVGFTVKITPAQVNDLMPYESAKTFTFEIPAKAGLKVDFSVGPIFSFGSNSRDNLYYLEEIPNQDNVVLRKRDNNNAVSPGLAAMMHFYGRTGKTGTLGGVFGIGAGFQNAQDFANFNFLVGLCYVLGKQQKIMINTGVSYLKVDRLKANQFIEDKTYATSKIDLANITEKVYKPSFFLSITYNLTNKVEVK